HQRVFLKQPHLSFTKFGNGLTTVRLKCQVKRDSSDSSIVHWYMQKPNKEIKRILHIADAKPYYDDDTDKTKFDSDKNSDTYTLVIQRITANQAATYYCANWDGDRHTD
ncbi:hypothetical protein GDO86_011525, partial [Hymenochirus boettgeri]